MPDEAQAKADTLSLELTTRDVEGCLDGGLAWLRFPPLLASQFERDTGPTRDRNMVARTIIGVLLLNSFLVVDANHIPDVLGLAVLLRTGLITAYCALACLLIARHVAPWLREMLQVGVVALTVVSMIVLIMASNDPLREQYFYGILLIMMYGQMVQRIRFWYMLPGSVLLFALYLLAVQQYDLFSWREQLGAASLMGGGIILSLVAGYALEREERISYLLALRQRLQNRELELLSKRDPLTGLGNRRALERRFSEWRRASRSGDRISVILADIDHFKIYNDSSGHLAGDRCLRRVADVLERKMLSRDADVFRFGGEEFIVLLRHQHQKQVLGLAEELRAAVEGESIPHPALGNGRVVTISLGFGSQMLGSDSNLDQLIAVADAALYDAKRNGRNRVTAQPFAMPAAACRNAV